MSSTYFISDLHIGHKNILKYDERPFFTVDENDKKIFDNWNNKVSNEDDVYILGDIGWKNADEMVEYFGGLNGKKHLIVGNHDSKLLRNKNIRNLFVEITDYKELHFDYGVDIVLCHYPIPCFKNHFYGWLHFYGHVHNSFEWDMIESFRDDVENKYHKPCHMYNVGCMVPYMNYTPMSWEEIIRGYTEWRNNSIEDPRDS